MHALLEILFMAVVGAVIGGFTNYLAIKMLFRPFQAVYIKKWKLPFTPGLIPKRRDEIARQLGEMVVRHLVTPESIEKKLLSAPFQNETKQWLKDAFLQWLDSKWTIPQMAAFFNIDLQEEKVKSWITKNIRIRYGQEKKSLFSQNLWELLPEAVVEKAGKKIPDLADLIIGRICDYISSSQGHGKIEGMIGHFLDDRGMIGAMVKRFIGNLSIADKIQPEIVKALREPGTKATIVEMLEKEWSGIKEKPIGELLPDLPDEEIIGWLDEKLFSLVPVGRLLGIPVQAFVSRYQEKILDEWIPKLTEKGLLFLSGKVYQIIRKLQVAELVRQEVESFPLERLEMLILGITSREFTMITYLGVLLGGLIGIIQGIIALIV
ncbi:UPF0754 membrane protein [Weizmannia acidilactici]|uniref:UPF0754 membrane protein n=1 Tax=Weizmannia acidilactici TaxID=2607726 RepID=A0A5J4JH64_9BACI|nr:DUF445 family protein [Weizmannia acidilactici]GER65821.1 UPF0754 membrane protein [Weizmannia acidilactici]GER69995.1 UPF0754 membrane protein [Weizmannia acidilactici]